MAVFKFTSHLQSFVNSAPGEAAGETVGVVLSAVLEGRDQLKSYILDEQGRLRRHVMIFVDGKLLGDRINLSDRVDESSEIYVMQALSGG